MAQLEQLAYGALLEVLNDVPDVVVFVKDSQSHYVYGNQTLLRRLNLKELSELQGKTASDLFPASLGANYTQQDQVVLQGQPLTDHLELHVYPSGRVGWCVTTKRVLRANDGEIQGLVGLSRDLSLSQAQMTELGEVMAYLREHYAQPLTVRSLAAKASMSVSSFERKVRRIFGVTPLQLVVRLRIEAAARWLRETDLPITEVALACGYYDHSAFSRVFRATVGMTPSDFRKLSLNPVVPPRDVG